MNQHSSISDQKLQVAPGYALHSDRGHFIAGSIKRLDFEPFGVKASECRLQDLLVPLPLGDTAGRCSSSSDRVTWKAIKTFKPAWRLEELQAATDVLQICCGPWMQSNRHLIEREELRDRPLTLFQQQSTFRVHPVQELKSVRHWEHRVRCRADQVKEKGRGSVDLQALDVNFQEEGAVGGDQLPGPLHRSLHGAGGDGHDCTGVCASTAIHISIGSSVVRCGVSEVSYANKMACFAILLRVHALHDLRAQPAGDAVHQARVKGVGTHACTLALALALL
mmetsp:Transcript_32118/g.73957  ORF Transcript_32118/g.73957 Transcript_32118/m.73957 type:complete len:279 (-) Transcript_32118:1082-1918(-)